MENDEFLCRKCRNRWVEENKGTAFCRSCYSDDIINLSREERAAEKKKKQEDSARARREERIQREKEYRRRILKNRDAARKHYRGKR